MDEGPETRQANHPESNNRANSWPTAIEPIFFCVTVWSPVVLYNNRLRKGFWYEEW
jgi:hypothetical protein